MRSPATGSRRGGQTSLDRRLPAAAAGDAGRKDAFFENARTCTDLLGLDRHHSRIDEARGFLAEEIVVGT
jgi:hypothetical protein